jgi:hypothetical protein
MNVDNASSRKDWFLFIVSAVIFFLMLIWLPQWFWLALPFFCTYLVKAVGMM